MFRSIAFPISALIAMVSTATPGAATAPIAAAGMMAPPAVTRPDRPAATNQTAAIPQSVSAIIASPPAWQAQMIRPCVKIGHRISC